MTQTHNRNTINLQKKHVRAWYRLMSIFIGFRDMIHLMNAYQHYCRYVDKWYHIQHLFLMKWMSIYPQKQIEKKMRKTEKKLRKK